jgi:hypothetical protein
VSRDDDGDQGGRSFVAALRSWIMGRAYQKHGWVTIAGPIATDSIHTAVEPVLASGSRRLR